MRNNLSLSLMIPVLMLTSCQIMSNSVSSNSSNNTKPVNVITYDDIYKYDYAKSSVLTGKQLYRASDGYIDNEAQGYNNFYYQVKTDDTYNNLIYSDGAFRSNGVVLDQNLMTSVSNFSATRCFLSPISGQARISGSVYLINGNSAHVKVFVNEKLIFEKDVDNDGIFHSDDVSLNIGDNVYFVIDGEATVSYNPVIDYTLKEETSLHHYADGYYGDVHPFYDIDSKKLYMFYLSTGNQSGTKHQTFESLLTTSTDFIHFNDEAISMNDKNHPEQDLYYVLNVIKDSDGNYRSAMGSSNHMTTSVSKDLHVWSNGPEAYIDPIDDTFKYRYAVYYDSTVYSGRDPDMYFDAEQNKYYTVFLTYQTSTGASGAKSMQLYIGNSKGEFESTGHHLLSFTGRGDSECPQIKKIGGRWYLFYSVYGTGTKGNVGKLAYRIGDLNVNPEDVNWESKEELYLDGGDLHAAQICEVGDKYYVYGWLNYEYNKNVWGGYLNLPHEIYQDVDGTLLSKLDPKLLFLLNKGLVYRSNNTYNSNSTIETKLTRNLITADLDMSTNNGDTGLSIKHGSDEYFVGVVSKNNKKYLTLKNLYDDYLSEILLKDNSKYRLTISLDGNFLDININDETTLSAYTNLTSTSKSFGVVSSGNSISNIKIYHLADYNNIYF